MSILLKAPRARVKQPLRPAFLLRLFAEKLCRSGKAEKFRSSSNLACARNSGGGRAR
jgi:hypothetical protein